MDSMKLDVLAFAAHPDDVELSIGGTICTLTKAGYDVGVVDFTLGELGSRGTPEGRLLEAEEASKVMGLASRDNIRLPDGNIENTPDARMRLIRLIRRYRPHIALINPLECRHPDHGDAARLAIDAMFAAGLRKIESIDTDGSNQEPWRPNHVLHYEQTIEIDATFIVDVSDVWEQRLEAIAAFRSQFFNESYEAEEDEPQTFVRNPEFYKWIEARARAYGYKIGATYGEPLQYRHGPVGISDLMNVLSSEKEFR